MKVTLNFFKKGKALTEENIFKTKHPENINDALEIAEYFFHEYGYGMQIIDNEGEIYAEYEG